MILGPTSYAYAVPYAYGCDPGCDNVLLDLFLNT
jgi:hypothetical protein